MRNFHQLKYLSLMEILRCFAKKYKYGLLCKTYGFDPWHAKSPYECRGYKREVVELAGSLNSKSVIEIGCGLGEIVSRIPNCNRFGFDIDDRVLLAARELHGVNSRFECAGVRDVDTIQNALGQENIDLLIMVNWPHTIPWSELAVNINRLTAALKLKYLIIDAINENKNGYSYHHSLMDLQALGVLHKSKKSIDGVRTLHVIKLN